MYLGMGGIDLERVVAQLVILNGHLKDLVDLQKPRVAVALNIYRIDGKTKRRTKMTFLKMDEQAAFVVEPVDSFGKVAPIDGMPSWALTNPALGELVVAEDGLTATFIPKEVGEGEVQVKGDADMTDGVKEIIGSMPIQVSSAEAVSFRLSATISKIPAVQPEEPVQPELPVEPSEPVQG